MLDFLRKLESSFKKNGHRNAIYQNGTSYTYAELSLAISKIRSLIQTNTETNEKVIAVVCHDDLETYASIFALWFEGRGYLPLNPEMPEIRNEAIVLQSGVKTILNSKKENLFLKHRVIHSADLSATEVNQPSLIVSDSCIAYYLFTSGTTNLPNCVPITFSNLESFIRSFNRLGFDFSFRDRFLQMFELTFDLSIVSFIMPLFYGACVYTVPRGKIKYSYIAELIEDYHITVALLTPSILTLLRPHFKDIKASSLRYCFFCGEALHADIVEEWFKCIPNATIYNFYGPTENTIFCTSYAVKRFGNNESCNGILSIGKPMESNIVLIVDEEDKSLANGKVGELCLAGPQLTMGYWNNHERNAAAFLNITTDGATNMFYKSGDLCKYSENGNLLYIGRKDLQVKVQGHRVELSEIEFHVKTFLKSTTIAVRYIHSEIILFIESSEFETFDLMAYLKKNLPFYMLPKRIEFIDTIKLNSSGKTDNSYFKSLMIKNENR